jgi:hypothetical protein
MMITFAPEELGLRNFSKMESPVAARNKRNYAGNPNIYTLLCSRDFTRFRQVKLSELRTYDSKSTL